MKVLQVNIQRFRGIKHLIWRVDGEYVCLVGPGDSTKTTILDAIELALTPRWNVQFDDTDFFDANTDEPFVIAVTVGELPDLLKSDGRFGFVLQGWSPDGAIHDEPEEDDALVFSIQLRVDSSLEPSWVVATERNPEGKSISARDREALGCIRLGDLLNRHFSWGRGSILSRLTGEAENLAQILADATRAARSVLAEIPEDRLPKLHDATARVARIGADVGVTAKNSYRPHLDVDAVSVGTGGLSLHDGDVPLRRAGLGTRRLLAVAMQRQMAKAGGITLVDEVEHGLEPHRVRRLLRVLRGAPELDTSGQVLMTTHAPTALQELSATEIRIVRCHEGHVTIRKVAPGLQRYVQRASEAFFARRVVVCEGRTELGFCRRLDQWWADAGLSFAYGGIALADGGGDSAPSVAQTFAELGYTTALLIDSDKPINPDRTMLEAAGVTVFSWEGGVSIEERIALDLPWEGVANVVQLAQGEHGSDVVHDAVAHRLQVDSRQLPCDPKSWKHMGIDETKLRQAVGLAAKQKGWFKRVDRAEKLTGIVLQHLGEILSSDISRKVCALRVWAHGHG